MDLPKELAFDRLSFEDKYHRAVQGYMRRICFLYEDLDYRIGCSIPQEDPFCEHILTKKGTFGSGD